jgi:GNAT superfamily N-acetyltransferase
VTPTEPPGVEIRRAHAGEADTIADLYTLIRVANVPAIPPAVHTPEEDRWWAAHMLLPDHDVWVADDAGTVVGFMGLRAPDWIGQLYFHPDYTGHGLGTRMMAIAKQELSGPIQLWTFQSNVGARRFYARHGFVEVEETDGDNEEQAPDVRLLFTP